MARGLVLVIVGKGPSVIKMQGHKILETKHRNNTKHPSPPSTKNDNSKPIPAFKKMILLSSISFRKKSGYQESFFWLPYSSQVGMFSFWEYSWPPDSKFICHIPFFWQILANICSFQKYFVSQSKSYPPFIDLKEFIRIFGSLPHTLLLTWHSRVTGLEPLVIGVRKISSFQQEMSL